jgi:phosphoribosylanthranilate isomerase
VATRVKICGVTRLEDARAAVDLGVWSLGLNFVPESPRRCPPGVAEEIALEVRRQVALCGVFSNAPLDEVALVADRAALSLLQLHGDEGVAYCREAARRTGCRVIKAARVKDAAAVQALNAVRTDFHLLDAWSPVERGGTGAVFDWSLVRLHDRSVPLMIAGGLTADNVGASIAAARPYAVDTASGVEAEPGRKDHARMTAFVRAVAAADALEPERDERPPRPGLPNWPSRPERPSRRVFA